MTDFRAMPKVELHLHLEGAAPPDFIRQLAAEQNADLSGIFDDAGAYQWTDFAEFLNVYEAACSVLNTPDAFRRLTERVLAEQATHNVIYTEIFLAPDLCGGGDPVAWRDYLAAIIEGAANAHAEHGIEARFISTCVRHFGPENAVKVAQMTAQTAGPMLKGFGMGGEERHLMPSDFAHAFAICEEAGLPLTCHAGEIAGAHMVSATLDALNVRRIGHGVRSIEDPGLVQRLVDEDIVLEVNPGSNISLCVFPDWSDHPIERLRAAGVKVTVSTDDPPYFHTDMTREYEMLARHHGWTEATLRDQNRVAMEAAFCDTATKDAITARL